jgi:outer membrane protein
VNLALFNDPRKAIPFLFAIVITIFLMTVPLTGYAQFKPQNLKIGVVNSEALYQAYPEFRKIEEKLAKEAEGMQANRQVWISDMEKRQAGIVEKENQLKAGATTFADKRKVQLQNEIDSLKVNLQERYNEQVTTEQEKLQQRKAELLSGVLESVNKQIDALGEQEGYDLIIDASNGTIVYARDPEDLTDKLLRRLKEK